MIGNEKECNMSNEQQHPPQAEPVSYILQRPDIVDLRPRITVFGVGGGGGNAVNNMITAGLEGVEFVVANTDAQSLKMSRADRRIQLGVNVTAGLGAGSNPEIGQAAAEECIDEIIDHIGDSHMVFITCGMGGGTGTGAAPVIARAARERGLLTVGVVTKPFNFERPRRMKLANAGIEELQKHVDTLIVIPNQNLFRIANENTSLVDAFAMADQVLYAGVASITDLMVREGLINLDFADVRSVMLNMGRAMMGTGEASGEGRALAAAEAAIANPLLDESSMHGARGLLISITGGRDMTLNEVDIAVTRVCDEVDLDANVIFGAILDEALEGLIRVSVVATGIDSSDEGAAIIPLASSVNQPVTPEDQPVKKNEASSATDDHNASASFNVDMMEALEEEIVESLEEDFRPKSQIFGQNMGGRSGAESVDQRAILSAQIKSERQATRGQALSGGQETLGVANVAQDSLSAGAMEAARMSNLEEFPSSIQQAVRGKVQEGEEVAHGPRWLLKKITQGFIQHNEERPVARLEPVDINFENQGFDKGRAKIAVDQSAAMFKAVQASAGVTPQRPDLFQGLSRATPQAAPLQRTRPQPVAAPSVAKKEAEISEDELEIPSFLRRQVS